MLLGWAVSALLFPTGTLTLPASSRPVLMALVGAAVLWALGIRALLGHFLRIGHQPPAIMRYVGALMETSLPTCA